MATYTYTVLYFDAEVSSAEANSFEFARDEALSEVPDFYPKRDLTFISTCDVGVLREVSGPCFF